MYKINDCPRSIVFRQMRNYSLVICFLLLILTLFTKSFYSFTIGFVVVILGCVFHFIYLAKRNVRDKISKFIYDLENDLRHGEISVSEAESVFVKEMIDNGFYRYPYTEVKSFHNRIIFLKDIIKEEKIILTNYKEFKTIPNDEGLDIVITLKESATSESELVVFCKLLFNDTDLKLLETDKSIFHYSDIKKIQILK